MAVKAGRKKKGRVYRRKRWVDSDEGVVRLRTKVIRRRRGERAPRKDPGPRPLPRPQKPRAPWKPQPFDVYHGKFGRLEAMRLLNRAGFGPAPGQAEKLAKLGMKKAVRSLTRPQGKAKLIGPEPVDGDGLPLAPFDSWGHDHLWWLDRMVRTNQPFRERMALVFHDWFATSNAGVSQQRQMTDQYWTLRAGVNGTFDDLVVKGTKDPAMLQRLNGGENNKWSPNENYARELMELFTLGADRGAYMEDDIREAARALTGWRYDWDDDLGAVNFRFDPEFHDEDSKKIFGKKGKWDWRDVCRLCVTHKLHASFFVDKLWSYFVPAAPSKGTRRALIHLYLKRGRKILPVVEAILRHRVFSGGPAMVRPPAVFNASLLRALKLPINSDAWTWLGDSAGQQLFLPPNGAGWDDDRWLDTSTVRARWLMVTYALDSRHHDAWNDSYRETESPRAAMNRALSALGWPPLHSDHQHELVAMSDRIPGHITDEWQRRPYLAMRQNALLQLIASCPDFQLS